MGPCGCAVAAALLTVASILPASRAHASVPTPEEPGAPSAAAPGSTFKLLIDRGAEQSKKGLYEEAIKSFEAAYRIVAHPNVLFNIASLQMKRRDWQGCIAGWTQFLREFRPPSHDDGPDGAYTEQERKARLEEHSSRVGEAEAKLKTCRDEIEKAELVRQRADLEMAHAARRPPWRIGLGAGLMGLGGVIAGFGIPALAISGRCVDSTIVAPQVCAELYDTTGLGAGLTAIGLSLLVSGAVTVALPPRARLRAREPVAGLESGGALSVEP